MQQHSRGVRVQVYFGETDQVGHRPRYQALLEYLRREGAAGATVVRGIAGFGHNSRIHTSAILRLSEDLPLILTWVDAPERVERLLPGLIELAGSGVVTSEEVGIAAYGGRRLEQLRFDLPASDVMTRPPVVIGADASVREAVEQLVGRPFRALPVVDADGRLVGMVSNADLVERAGLPVRLELLAALPAAERERLLAGLSGVSVGEVMSRDPVSLGHDESLATATRLMSERRLKRLPVVDADGSLVGVLSRGDVLRAVGESFPRAADAEEHPAATTLAELMRTDIPAVAEDADLADVLDAVASTRLNRAVVIDADRRVVGIVSDADVLRSLGESLPEGVLDVLMRAGRDRVRSGRRARDLVTGTPDTLPADATLAQAATLVMERGRKILPIVDADERLLGIVDRADLLHASGGALQALTSEDEDA